MTGEKSRLMWRAVSLLLLMLSVAFAVDAQDTGGAPHAPQEVQGIFKGGVGQGYHIKSE